MSYKITLINQYENFWRLLRIAEELGVKRLYKMVALKIREKELEMLNEGFTEDELDYLVIHLKEKMEKENEEC